MMSFTTIMIIYKLNDNMAGSKTSHHDQAIISVSFNRTKTTVNTSAMPISSPPLSVDYVPTYREIIKVNHTTVKSSMYPISAKSEFAPLIKAEFAFPAEA